MFLFSSVKKIKSRTCFLYIFKREGNSENSIFYSYKSETKKESKKKVKNIYLTEIILIKKVKIIMKLF